MLDRAFVRQYPEVVRAACMRKGIEPPIETFLKIDADRRGVMDKLDRERAEMNRIAKQIGALMGQGRREEAEAAKAQTAHLKENIARLEPEAKALDEELKMVELQFPNLPHETVPNGDSADRNVIVRSYQEKQAFEFEPKPHWELCESLGLVDSIGATKISGSGFAAYRGLGAKLQRALITFMIDHQTQSNGYTEIYPPYLVNSASLIGTGQLPKFEEDLFKVDENLYLIPTAEVPITNLYRDEMLDLDQLPLRMAGFSACFRREAGAAGKDTRGIQRMHQFDKVELVKIVTPESSYDELETLVGDAESILQALGLHYRVSLLCAGDMSFGNSKCYDLEVWSPGIGNYLEVSSCSNFEAFQARRANMRFKRGQGEKPEFVHTLNGSGLAVPRLYAALVETYQQPDGSVRLPLALHAYMGTHVLSNTI